jgi:hypothetical protein
VLRQAGLNYDELRALDPVAVGVKIVEAAFDSRADSTIDDAESRYIAAEVVEWILEQPADQVPTPEDVVRKSIELTIANVTLTEVAAQIQQNGTSQKERLAAEQMVRDLAAELAGQASLTSTGATEQEMAAAIEGGIRDIGRIFGVES